MLKRALPVLVGLLLGSSQAFAAPCTNDYWQPTFVHDLDVDDWPYYVAPDMSFIRLEHRQNGGFYPNACELVRGPQDVRDLRGFTSCHEYTRIQCGCSRSLPGNSTCAAFLRWHTAAPVVTPGPIVPPVSQPVSVPLTPSAWQQASQYSGPIFASQPGLVVQGGPWTNGKLQNGFYDGNRIFSAQVFDLSNGGDAYMRFLANGNGQYMGFWPRVFEGVSVHHMTTHHSWANSVVVPENTWIFAHVRVEADASYRIAVSSGDYDNRGGQVIYSNAGRLANMRGRLELQFADNYGGTNASMVIGEAMVQ